MFKVISRRSKSPLSILSRNFSKHQSSQIKTRRWLYVFPLITATLGAWQVYRLQWKNSLIETMQSQLSKPPTILNLNNDTPLQSLEHARVRVTGEFMHELEMLVGPRNKGGPGRSGYYCYTPMRIRSDVGHKLILINRGWIPASHVSRGKRRRLNAKYALPEGETSLVGMLRKSSLFKPKIPVLLPSPHVTSKDSASDTWAWVDVPLMKEWLRDNISSTDLLDTLQCEYFVEEVIDMERITQELNSSDQSPEDTQILNNMLHWYQTDMDRDKDTSALPSILAAVKIQHTDPEMFYGKPVVIPPTVNVPNKHQVYIYTWFSLTGFLLLILQFSGKKRFKKLK